ncbi:MAG: hypothetical protein LUI14_14615 [Lachnospiraceae bacterium]|nr:hypothetical protein [Lachnospiraceae bacterium]
MKKITKMLQDSPINYYSDLFVISMVIGWVVVLIIMVVFAIYAEIVYGDTSIWSYVKELVTEPLSAGGAIWMIKCAVQHAIANNSGKQAHMDFPKVDTDEIELETAVNDEPKG